MASALSAPRTTLRHRGSQGPPGQPVCSTKPDGRRWVTNGARLGRASCLCALTACRLSNPFVSFSVPVRGSSDKTGTMQRRPAWPLRNDCTHQSKRVSTYCRDRHLYASRHATTPVRFRARRPLMRRASKRPYAHLSHQARRLDATPMARKLSQICLFARPHSQQSRPFLAWLEVHVSLSPQAQCPKDTPT